MTPALSAITGWALFAALIVSVGAVTGRWLIAPRVEGERRATLISAARRLGVLGGAMLPVAMVLVFWRQIQEFRDPFVPFAEDFELLLTGTSWGRSWLWAAVASLLLPVLFLFAQERRSSIWWFATVVLAGLCTFPALTGHANATEGLRWLSLPADGLHVVAAGTWIGGLTFVLIAERLWRRRANADSSSLLPTLVPLFSPIALVSVACLAVTGTLAAWLNLVALNELWTTPYGRLLSLKLGVVATVLGLGALNWRRLTPRLAEADGPQALRRAATLELVLAHVVIVVTAIFVRTSPLH